MHGEHSQRGKHASLNLSVRSIYWSESPIYLTAAQNAFGCLSHVGNVLGNASQLHQSQANPGGCVFGSLPCQQCVGSQAPRARMKRLGPTSVSEHPAWRPRGFRQHSLNRLPGRHLCAVLGVLCHPASAPLTPPWWINNSHLALEGAQQ